MNRYLIKLNQSFCQNLEIEVSWYSGGKDLSFECPVLDTLP